MEINNSISIVMKNGTKMPLASHQENLNFVDGWFLMGSPLPTAVILVSYLLLVLKFGPKYMKKREPYKLQNIILLYNAVQVGYSCFLTYISFQAILPHGLFPKSCVTEIGESRRNLSVVMYCYLLAKLSELLDTIFFVLRKKENQVTFLHVYHHTTMVIMTWTSLKYEPTFFLIFMMLINSFVHVIMYTYYGLSSFPSLAKYLWWKKYITRMQLIQFLMLLVHFAVASMTSECTPSYVLSVATVVNGFLFLYLFGTFYIRTYNKKTNSKDRISNGKIIDHGINNNLHEKDADLYSNGAKVANIHEKLDNGVNETKFTSASIKLNDAYKIKFNFESKKLM